MLKLIEALKQFGDRNTINIEDFSREFKKNGS